MKALVSIIIPVYNVEKYLAQCLESVCGQSYKNLEIIVIDDESPDHSGEIAEEFAKRENRVRVEHIKNRGAAGARNVGLELCTGKFIMFVDSDDWVEPNMVEKLMSAIEKTGSDIALCQYWDEYKNQSTRHEFMDCSGVQTPEEFAAGMIEHWEYIITWNKLFQRSVLEGVRFAEGHCIDDEFFTYKAVIKSKKTVLVDACLYHYRMRKSSAMRNPKHRKQRAKDQVAFITERYQPLCTAFPAIRSLLLQHKTEVLLTVIRDNSEFPEVVRSAQTHLRKSILSVLMNAKIDRNIQKSAVVFIIKAPQAKLQNITAAVSQEAYFD